MVKAVQAKPMASKKRRSRIFKFPLKANKLDKKLNKLMSTIIRPLQGNFSNGYFC